LKKKTNQTKLKQTRKTTRNTKKRANKHDKGIKTRQRGSVITNDPGRPL
jgi:hypothetical protein